MQTVKQSSMVMGIGLLISCTFQVNSTERSTDKISLKDLERIEVQGQQKKLLIESEAALIPGGVSLVNGDDLYQRNVANLADMLRYVPGMWVASGSTGDSTFFSSRGSNLDATSYDGNGIKLLQDGLPVTAADGNNHNRAVDPLSARYAVVARGANALAYGASTLGGAIDFITPTAHDIQSPEIYLNLGSHGHFQGRFTASTVVDQFDGLITVEKKMSDGFREHQQQRREGLYANAGWVFDDKVKTRFYATYIHNDQELPGALSQHQFNDDPYQGNPSSIAGHYQHDVETWRLANITDWQLSKDSRLSVGISYEEQALYHPIVENPYFSLLIDTDQHTLGTSVRYQTTFNNHDLLLGLNYGKTTVEGGNYRQSAGIRKDISTVVDNNADSVELFLLDRWQFAADWKLIYGLQFVSATREVRNTNVTNNAFYNPNEDYQRVNPRVGIIYQLSADSELFANVSRLYEPPTTYELEDDASQDSKALAAMNGDVIEFGSRGHIMLNKLDQWRWELAFYYGKLNDEILSIDDPMAPGTSLSTNVERTIHAGVEAMVGGSFSIDNAGEHVIEPVLSVTLNDFSFDDDANYHNNKLPVAPDYAVKGEVIYRHANGFFAGPTFDFVDGRYADFTNTYHIDSYHLLGFRAGFSRDRWEFFAELRNITDQEYVSVFSVKDTTAPEAEILQAGEPRSVYAGIKYRF
ncbi:TonB-dependent receptor [Thalassotalea sp. 1_MG-2023]|uniref:TonB-dependent receptor family protein n=1 Tax=Thalassotalea sp. 1_MG-2023 TaxID=3062680 RepID=UPI0026E2BF41|nr:TonB-dependent receptor [Thalassotalea sp. 1_MG-2023]MDO6426554.1 TonB-dependent receptor [Thalassotalea sp. 1_MG-2023]